MNYLKLNNDKTEFLMLGSRQQLRKVSIPPLVVGSAHIPPSDKVKNLGVVFDTAMTLEAQISQSVKSANYNLRNIRAIIQILTATVMKYHVSVDCQESYIFPRGYIFPKRAALRENIITRENITILAPPTRDISSVPVNICYIRWSK